jgi:tight adherence protein C
MIWAVGGTFVATVLVILAMVYAFSSENLVVAKRLARLWVPSSVEPRTDFRARQKQKMQQVLGDVGKLTSPSTKKLSSARRLMVRAGYRRPEAAMAMQGVKVLLPVGLLALVYFTGIYRQNPFFILGFAAVAGYLVPEFWLSSRIRRRQHRIRLSLPDALDLLVVCVEAGLALDQALLRVAQELRIAHPELCDELDLVSAEIRVGKSRVDALRELAARTGVDDVKALVAMLVQTDRFGTSIARSLRVHSDALRTKRRQRAEEKAAKTTVKMVPPLVFGIFPALYVVILGPAIITVVRQFFPALQR